MLSDDGNWGAWSAFSTCSATCGRDAVKTRTRQCNNPAPSPDGRPCEGDAEDSEPCFLQDCPGKSITWLCGFHAFVCNRVLEDTKNHVWSYFSGYKLIFMTSIVVIEAGYCVFDDAERGSWGDWSAWTQCSVSGGGGQRERQRACDDPPPRNGGPDCAGDAEQIDYCNPEPCPSR